MRYKTIYADPPWKLQSMSDTSWKTGRMPLESKYPLMKLKDIQALDVASLADDDCSLFLWCTQSTLQDALDTMKIWGFKYHVVITWDKGGGFSLWGFHRRTELLLYGYKGKINVNQKGKYIPTLFTEKKTHHSAKPQVAYEMLESNTPEPRLEMFARIKRPGWHTWGNELENEVELNAKREKDNE